VSVTCGQVRDWVRAFAAAIAENKDYLTELDAAIGDADHGINMHRGTQAVLGKLGSDASGDIGALLKSVGRPSGPWGDVILASHSGRGRHLRQRTRKH
jgi:dihydroxyacetone kinase